ncbi:MAG: DNA starvation/stationary phase protection protein [Phycisphaerae bacterium]|nr:DNA starvation/stationary phase protection protein [Phycisphaerae bacterium]
MTPNIGINDSNRQAVSQILAAVLADEHVLYVKTRNYHWNVVGPQFNDLHKFLEQQYNLLEESIDAVAERIRTLGSKSPGTMTEFVKLARLKEEPGKFPNARSMVGNLLADHETLIRQLRTDLEACGSRFGDAGTNDFLTGLMEQHEKMAWMLRAFLEE